MNRIDAFFDPPTRKALIAYLTVGYPDVEATVEVAESLVKNGCDMIELGIPFSDPLADGTTIQRASHRALQSGITPQRCLEAASELRKRVDVPLIFMGYYNPMLHYGLDGFCRDSSNAGIDGLIIPDLPPEEGSELEEVAAGHGMDLIYLLAPTTTDENRLRLVADSSRGFIYVVSLKGVTGARDTLPAELEGFIARIRSVTGKPLCVGFGIATPEQAGRVAGLADGVIMGSRILDIVENSSDPARDTGDFIRQVREAMSDD
jgi:tryptophan synthase alpha chain